MVPRDSPTDMQNHMILSNCLAVDFTDQFERPSGIVAASP